MAKKDKDFDLDSYKDSERKYDVQYKPDQYIPIHKEFQNAIGQPGIKMGAVSAVYGLSNSGKTSIMLHIAIEAQKAGQLACLIVTENKMDWSRAEAMGLDLKKCIIRQDLKWMEDIYDYISIKVEDIKTGRLPKDVVFLWDSVAASPSKESMEIDRNGAIKKKYTNQKNANTIGYYNPIIMERIGTTKEAICKNIATLVMFTQAYEKPSQMPGIPPTLVPNGGEKVWYPLSACLELKEGQQLKCKVKGRDIIYGTVCRVKLSKNHNSELSMSGQFVIAGNEFLANEKEVLEDYKERSRPRWEAELDKYAGGADLDEE